VTEQVFRRGRAEVSRARMAVTAVFFVTGAGLGVWAAYIPLLKAGLALNDAELGLVLLGMGLGAIASMPLAGFLAHRYGPTRVTALAAPAYAATLALPPFAPSQLSLAACAFLIGLSIGVCDIAMNVHAGAVERAFGRPIMSSIHAFFSVGGLCGGAAAAGLIWLGVGAAPGMPLAALTLAAVALIAAFGLALPEPEAFGEGPAFRLPNAAVIGLGALALCSFICEGAMMEWSAVFLRDAAGAPLAIAASGYAAFSAAMTLGRLVGDRAVAALGAARAVQASGAVAALALLLVVAAPNAWIAYAGLALAGLGFANVVPALFSAAGRVPGVAPAAALSMIATVGYAGGLAGPPAIGFVSHAFGLRAGFLILVAAAAIVALGARAALSPPAGPRPG